MPRSKNKEIFDLFERIRNDEILRSMFAKLIIDIIKSDLIAGPDLVDYISREIAESIRYR